MLLGGERERRRVGEGEGGREREIDRERRGGVKGGIGGDSICSVVEQELGLQFQNSCGADVAAL